MNTEYLKGQKVRTEIMKCYALHMNTLISCVHYKIIEHRYLSFQYLLYSFFCFPIQKFRCIHSSLLCTRRTKPHYYPDYSFKRRAFKSRQSVNEEATKSLKGVAKPKSRGKATQECGSYDLAGRTFSSCDSSNGGSH